MSNPKQCSPGAPLAVRYNAGWRFFKPVVLRVLWNGVAYKWVTCGTDHNRHGCFHATFEEAIKEAVDGHRR